MYLYRIQLSVIASCSCSMLTFSLKSMLFKETPLRTLFKSGGFTARGALSLRQFAMKLCINRLKVSEYLQIHRFFIIWHSIGLHQHNCQKASAWHGLGLEAPFRPVSWKSRQAFWIWPLGEGCKHG